MPVDRNMRLPDLAQGGTFTVGELIDAIKAEVLTAVMAQVEQAVLADLRALMASVRPTKPEEPHA